MNVKRKVFYIVVTFIALILLGFSFLPQFREVLSREPPIKVGILHSLTGTMSISEKPVVDAVLLAIEEINAAGGLLGAKIIPVIADGKSDPDVFQSEAERLIVKENVKAIFGCWTSASRKAVKPVVEKYNSLLFYPVQYEGMEQSPNIVYLGPAPNQQLIPAIKWSYDHLGKRFFLVGSDYIFPRAANQIARDLVGYLGGEVVGEEYAPLGSKNFLDIVKKIKEAKPDVILNTINGDSNVAFFEDLRELEALPTPVMSLSITENEIKAFRGFLEAHFTKDAELIFKNYLVGSYACWPYFENIDTPINNSLLKKFADRYGRDYHLTDPQVAGYYGVYLWSKAVEEGKDIDNAKNIIDYLRRISVVTPKGILTIASTNQAPQQTLIGKLNAMGIFEIVWASGISINPDVYPPFNNKEFWDKLIERFYIDWGGHWTANNASPELREWQ